MPLGGGRGSVGDSSLFFSCYHSLPFLTFFFLDFCAIPLHLHHPIKQQFHSLLRINLRLPIQFAFGFAEVPIKDTLIARCKCLYAHSDKTLVTTIGGPCSEEKHHDDAEYKTANVRPPCDSTSTASLDRE